METRVLHYEKSRLTKDRERTEWLFCSLRIKQRVPTKRRLQYMRRQPLWSPTAYIRWFHAIRTYAVRLYHLHRRISIFISLVKIVSFVRVINNFYAVKGYMNFEKWLAIIYEIIFEPFKNCDDQVDKFWKRMRNMIIVQCSKTLEFTVNYIIFCYVNVELATKWLQILSLSPNDKIT